MTLTSKKSTYSIVIIGSGLAAYTLAREFRKLNSNESIALITRDSGDFYSKPMLSTAFTNKKLASELITNSREVMEQQLNIHIYPFTDVFSIHDDERFVITNHGNISYQKLVFAAGADPIRLTILGNAAHEVLSVNDLDDYQVFQDQLKTKRKVLILGAGLIGSEFANDLINGGHEVSVVDLSTTPLARLLPEQSANLFKQKLAEVGVKWHLGTTVKEISRSSKSNQLHIQLENGDSIFADIVLSAIGLKPRTELASTLKISVNRGIIVDRFLRTNIEHIFALGDCAEVDGLILPYVMPIMHSARALAQTLCGIETQVNFPAMPVVVKTPAINTVVAPPNQGTNGQWKIQLLDHGVDARFFDANGKLCGFALLGSATNLKAQLTKELPSLH